MAIQKFLDGAENLKPSQLENRFYKLVRSSYRYKNLNAQNRKLILAIVKKYLKYVRRGIGISGLMIRREINKLKKDKIKLGLSMADISDIQRILEEFKK